MPQLETSTFVTQIFWLIVTFVSFWLIMDKFIVPKIAETIEARKRKRDDYILRAEEVNKKALVSLKEYENTLATAKSHAAEEIEKNEQDLKKEISEKEEDVRQKLKEKIAENEASLAEERAEILSKIDEISQNAAYEILQALGIKTITKEDISELVKKEQVNG